MQKKFVLALATLLLVAGGWLGLTYAKASMEERDKQAYQNTATQLGEDLGLPVYLRIIKEKRELELWVQRGEQWQLKKCYPILAMSGELGPKTMEGDEQAPEGFYEVGLAALNPKSRFHLAFNIGYPNAYDRSLGRTGSFIMVHGSHYSIGCFAMGDEGIEEIYTMLSTALQKGQEVVLVQIYPFEMTPERMEAESQSPHVEFWQYLQPGWQYSQQHHAPYLGNKITY